jgi:hypothetical protein
MGRKDKRKCLGLSFIGLGFFVVCRAKKKSATHFWVALN